MLRASHRFHTQMTMSSATPDQSLQVALPLPAFDRFYKHHELTELLQAFASARPELVELRELGRSHENRPIWVLVLTRKSTGLDTDKPAFWVDGNIHAAELTASTACLYWLHHLLS